MESNTQNQRVTFKNSVQCLLCSPFLLPPVSSSCDTELSYFSKIFPFQHPSEEEYICVFNCSQFRRGRLKNLFSGNETCGDTEPGDRDAAEERVRRAVPTLYRFSAGCEHLPACVHTATPPRCQSSRAVLGESTPLRLPPPHSFLLFLPLLPFIFSSFSPSLSAPFLHSSEGNGMIRNHLK